MFIILYEAISGKPLKRQTLSWKRNDSLVMQNEFKFQHQAFRANCGTHETVISVQIRQNFFWAQRHITLVISKHNWLLVVVKILEEKGGEQEIENQDLDKQKIQYGIKVSVMHSAEHQAKNIKVLLNRRRRNGQQGHEEDKQTLVKIEKGVRGSLNDQTLLEFLQIMNEQSDSDSNKEEAEELDTEGKSEEWYNADEYDNWDPEDFEQDETTQQRKLNEGQEIVTEINKKLSEKPSKTKTRKEKEKTGWSLDEDNEQEIMQDQIRTRKLEQSKEKGKKNKKIDDMLTWSVNISLKPIKHNWENHQVKITLVSKQEWNIIETDNVENANALYELETIWIAENHSRIYKTSAKNLEEQKRISDLIYLDIEVKGIKNNDRPLNMVVASEIDTIERLFSTLYKDY